jgi:hypothetical protein
VRALADSRQMCDWRAKQHGLVQMSGKHSSELLMQTLQSFQQLVALRGWCDDLAEHVHVARQCLVYSPKFLLGK